VRHALRLCVRQRVRRRLLRRAGCDRPDGVGRSDRQRSRHPRTVQRRRHGREEDHPRRFRLFLQWPRRSHRHLRNSQGRYPKLGIGYGKMISAGVGDWRFRNRRALRSGQPPSRVPKSGPSGDRDRLHNTRSRKEAGNGTPETTRVCRMGRPIGRRFRQPRTVCLDRDIKTVYLLLDEGAEV
jgi:hypothetical protein